MSFLPNDIFVIIMIIIVTPPWKNNDEMFLFPSSVSEVAKTSAASVKTLRCCPGPCDVPHLEEIKTAAGSKKKHKKKTQQYLWSHAPASPCAVYDSLSQALCLFLNL